MAEGSNSHRGLEEILLDLSSCVERYCRGTPAVLEKISEDVKAEFDLIAAVKMKDKQLKDRLDQFAQLIKKPQDRAIAVEEGACIKGIGLQEVSVWSKRDELRFYEEKLAQVKQVLKTIADMTARFEDDKYRYERDSTVYLKASKEEMESLEDLLRGMSIGLSDFANA